MRRFDCENASTESYRRVTFLKAVGGNKPEINLAGAKLANKKLIGKKRKLRKIYHADEDRRAHNVLSANYYLFAEPSRRNWNHVTRGHIYIYVAWPRDVNFPAKFRRETDVTVLRDASLVEFGWSSNTFSVEKKQQLWLHSFAALHLFRHPVQSVPFSHPVFSTWISVN